MDRKIKVKNVYYVSMVYNLLVEDKLKVSIFEIQHMLQWGTPYDLEIYNDWSKYFNNILLEQPNYTDTNDTTLILPMAGAGSRFSIKGYTNPKPLLNVCGFPMIVQAVNCLPDTSNKIFVCLEEHLNKYNIQNILEENYKNSNVLSINKITEGQACTTEIGITTSNLELNKPILISACDNGVYYNKEKTIAYEDRFFFRRRWTERSLSVQEAMAKMIRKSSALIQVSNETGKEFAFSIVPLYVWENRVLLKGKGMLKVGERQALSKDWEGALQSWMRIYENSSKRKERAKAAHNIAFAYEVLGDLKTAQNYASKAYVEGGKKASLEYSSILDQLIRQQDKIKEQMKNFE